MIKFIMSHPLALSWNGIPVEEVPVWKGCNQGSLERPTLWNILLDEAMASVPQQFVNLGVGVYAPTPFPDHRSRQPKSWGDRAGWVTHLAFSDDILIANSVDELPG